jgi:hypothetical protein
MTKDGRPSRINDIRYFSGDERRYLEGHNEAVAFGRRMAWLLNGEGFSLGAHPSLYIFLTPHLTPGAIQVTDRGGDWWQRYTNVGVPRDFPNTSDAHDVIVRGTVSALSANRPDLVTMVRDAEQSVRSRGDELRFLLKTRQTRRFIVDISFNIAAWPQTSFLFVSLTSRATGAFLEAPPIELQFYHEAFQLAGLAKVTDDTASVSPNKSMGAQLTSMRHGGPLVMPISESVPKERPTLSKLVKLRG